MSTTLQSFMITNRDDPTALSQSPLPSSDLWWYASSNQCDANYKNYSAPTPATGAAPTAFTDAVQAALNAQANPSLTIFIHGLDCYWGAAVTYTAQLAANLAQAGYTGLVVGFSWPSNGPFDLTSYSNGYPPTATAGSVRGNILVSVANFANLLAWIASLKVNNLSVNVICHSEGNFMLEQGLPAATSPTLNQVLMLAADINNGAFLAPSGDAGSAANIAASAQDVTVYYSTNDPILSDSAGIYGCGLTIGATIGGVFHNPSFQGRLGLSGPAYNQGTQASNLVGLDCSQVISQTNVGSLSLSGLSAPPSTPPVGVGLHTAYLYVPQVLADMAATLNGTAPADRNSAPQSGSYVMTLAST